VQRAAAGETVVVDLN